MKFKEGNKLQALEEETRLLHNLFLQEMEYLQQMMNTLAAIYEVKTRILGLEKETTKGNKKGARFE